MRIISGLHKNRKINFSKLNVRPTTDFAKESLFNILNNYYNFHEITVLDLFAGSGNISYEFISRGCDSILAVDNNLHCMNFINTVKTELKMENLKTQLVNAYTYLKKINKKYDVIFADPPYNHLQDDYNQIINLVFDRKLLTDSGILVLEHSKLIKFQNNPFFYEHRKYGSINFTFLKI